jgi:membrane protein required for colicin V production
MYWLDTAILAVLVLTAVLGARTGFVGQVTRLLALGLALYASVRLHDRVAPLLEQSVLAEAPAWVVRAAAYATAFLAIYAVLLTLALVLDRGVRAAEARWLDRVLGAALGAAKAGLVLGLVFLALAALAPDVSQEVAEKSSFAPRLSAGVQGLFEAIPAQYREGLQAQLRAAVGDED